MSDEAQQVPQFLADIEGELCGIVAQHEEYERTKPTGRPSKMRYDRIVTVLTNIAIGTPMIWATAKAGIEAVTWRDWCERYPRLKDFVEMADGEYVSSSVAMIADGRDIKGQPDWKAKAWLLERRKREEFAAPKQVEINNHVTNNTLTVSMDTATLMQLQDAHKSAAQAISAQRSAPSLPAIEAEVVQG